MTEREQLAELIDYYFGVDSAYYDVDKYELADHLLSSGIIVPPVKVGQTVWFVRDKWDKKVTKTDIEKIVLKHGGLYIKLYCNAMYETSCKSIGKTVFLTREEAENALKERTEK